PAAPPPPPTRTSAARAPAASPPKRADVARALIVGCGCSGRALGAELLEEGWAVRGTAREGEGRLATEAVGIDPARAAPERPATVLELVDDVPIVFWLLGSAKGPSEEL